MNFLSLIRATTLFAFVAVLLVPTVVSAQSQILFSQSYGYDVHLRGNGEAIVNVRATVSNTETKPIESLTLSASKGISITEVGAYQEVSGFKCQPIPLTDTPEATDLPMSTPGSGSTSAQNPKTMIAPDCIDPNQASDSIYYPYNRQTMYKKVEAQFFGSSLVFTLPEPIKTDTTATIVFAYAAKGYVTSRWGIHEFAFQTLKSTSRIKDVSVAVTVDDDVYLDGAKSNVNYQEASNASELGSRLTTNGVADSSVKSYIAGIGSQGYLVKRASQLAADESFTVSGRYSESSWRLTLRRWAPTLIILAIIAGALWAWYVLRRRRSQRNDSGPKNLDAGSGGSTAEVPKQKSTPNVNASRWQAVPGSGVVQHVYQSIEERRIPLRVFGWLCALGTMLTAGLALLLAAHVSHVSYNSYQNDSSQTWLIGLEGVAGYAGLLVLFLIIAFLLPWLYAHGRGGKAFLTVLLHQVLLLVLFTITIGLIVTNSGQTQDEIYPVMDDCPNCLKAQ